MFRGRPLDPRILIAMKLADERGEIFPYYGVGGSRGCNSYMFRQTDTIYSVSVTNTHTKESHEFVNVSGQIEESIPYDPKIEFAIDGKEYKTLKRLKVWNKKVWNKKEALSSRYDYIFGIVSLGRGYATIVRDNLSKIEFNVTDTDSE
jgi:hypothetical protein